MSNSFNENFSPILKTKKEKVISFQYNWEKHGDGESIMDCLNRVMLFFCENAGVRDNLSNFKESVDDYGCSVSVESEKTGIRMSLGIYQDEFYISTQIEHLSRLQSMDDQFWRMVLEIESLDGFLFQLNTTPTSLQAEKSKSSVFNLVAHYLLMATSGGRVDPGLLEVACPLGTDHSQLLENGPEIFAKIHKFNSLLCSRVFC